MKLTGPAKFKKGVLYEKPNSQIIRAVLKYNNKNYNIFENDISIYYNKRSGRLIIQHSFFYINESVITEKSYIILVPYDTFRILESNVFNIHSTDYECEIEITHGTLEALRGLY